MYICIYVFIYIRMYICIYLYIYMYICIFLPPSTVNFYIYVYIHTNMYIHIHIYIYVIYTPNSVRGVQQPHSSPKTRTKISRRSNARCASIPPPPLPPPFPQIEKFYVHNGAAVESQDVCVCVAPLCVCCGGRKSRHDIYATSCSTVLTAPY